MGTSFSNNTKHRLYFRKEAEGHSDSVYEYLSCKVNNLEQQPILYGYHFEIITDDEDDDRKVYQENVN